MPTLLAHPIIRFPCHPLSALPSLSVDVDGWTHEQAESRKARNTPEKQIARERMRVKDVPFLCDQLFVPVRVRVHPILPQTRYEGFMQNQGKTGQGKAGQGKVR